VGKDGFSSFKLSQLTKAAWLPAYAFLCKGVSLPLRAYWERRGKGLILQSRLPAG
jgi:hypothetical protein